jgi:hypothetical protein
MTTELEGKLRLSLQNSGYSEGTVNRSWNGTLFRNYLKEINQILVNSASAGYIDADGILYQRFLDTISIKDLEIESKKKHFEMVRSGE